MSKFFLVNRISKESRLVDPKEVLMVRVIRGTLVFYTADGEYCQVNTLRDMMTYLEPYGFVNANSGEAINLEKVQDYDTTNDFVYFNEDEKLPYATVARYKTNLIKQLKNLVLRNG